MRGAAWGAAASGLVALVAIAILLGPARHSRVTRALHRALFPSAPHADVTLPSAPAPGVDEGPPRVALVGRFDRRDPLGPRFAWSGSSMVARFAGTEVTLRLRDLSARGPLGPNTYTVAIDDRPPWKLTSDAATTIYPLARDLPEGEHVVTVFKNTEAKVGEGQFQGFDFGPRGRLLPPPRPARRIEFIGDSILAGYGDEGESARCSFSTQTENAYETYAALASRALGADAMLLAWSGIGTYRNEDGSREDTMNVLYPRTLPADPSSVEGPGAWSPDVVVVHLGSNDFETGDPPEEGFVRAYDELLAMVRSRYPAAQIFCLLGPMISDAYPPGAEALTTARREIVRIVEAHRRAGDARIHYVELPDSDPADGLGCVGHPSLKTQRLHAALFLEALHATLAW